MTFPKKLKAKEMGSPMQHSTQHEVVGTRKGIRITSFSVEWGLWSSMKSRGDRRCQIVRNWFIVLFLGAGTTPWNGQDFGVGKMISKSYRREEDTRDFYLFSRKRNRFFLFQLLLVTMKGWINVGRVQASDRICYHLQLCVKRVRLLRNLGREFKFHKHAVDGTEGKESTWKGKFRLLISIPIVIIVLILFSALFLASIHQILCNPGYSLLPGSFAPRWATIVFQNQHLKDCDS